MRRRTLAVMLAALAWQAAAAETPMDAAAFEAYVLGKTLFYSNQGQDYGAEQYLSGRRVIWTFLDGECHEGHWYAEGELICFVYKMEMVPQCWSFWERSGGLAARFENDPAATELYEVRQSPEPLRCPGPDVGA